MGSKWVANRIIDAEGVRKPLHMHLGRYHSALKDILAALGREKREPVTSPGASNWRARELVTLGLAPSQ